MTNVAVKTLDLPKAFMKNGWIVIDLCSEGKRLVGMAQEILLRTVRELADPDIPSIEEYHEYAKSNHYEVQAEAGKRLHVARIARHIVISELDFMRSLIGMDLHIQKFPYLRMARPGLAQDNIGFHRDTYYGNNAYEISMLIPFTHNGAGGYLSMMSGSHTMTAEEIPYEDTISEDVEKGSLKHSLGFLYAPRKLPDWVNKQMVSVPVFPGQALVFAKSTVHGQEINHSSQTRMTCDVSLVNSLAPVHWYRSVHKDYYEPLCSSPITEIARQYHGEGV